MFCSVHLKNPANPKPGPAAKGKGKAKVVVEPEPEEEPFDREAAEAEKIERVKALMHEAAAVPRPPLKRPQPRGKGKSAAPPPPPPPPPLETEESTIAASSSRHMSWMDQCEEAFDDEDVATTTADPDPTWTLTEEDLQEGGETDAEN